MQKSYTLAQMQAMAEDCDTDLAGATWNMQQADRKLQEAEDRYAQCVKERLLNSERMAAIQATIEVLRLEHSIDASNKAKKQWDDWLALDKSSYNLAQEMSRLSDTREKYEVSRKECREATNDVATKLGYMSMALRKMGEEQASKRRRGSIDAKDKSHRKRRR